MLALLIKLLFCVRWFGIGVVENSGFLHLKHPFYLRNLSDLREKIIGVSVLAVLFFTCMWVAFPSINGLVLKQLIGATPFKITVSSINEEFMLKLKAALSLGVLPLFALGSFLLIKRGKNPEYATGKLVFILSIVFAAYLVGFLLKFLLILLSMGVLASEPTYPDIVSNIPLNQIYFYDYALVCSIIAALLLWVIAKRKIPRSNSNTL